jgi:hypothetical protein
MCQTGGEIEAARSLFDHVRAVAAAAAAAPRNARMLVSGHSFCGRIAAGFPSGLGEWLLREGCARRGHGSRGLVVPIDAQGMAEALRAQEFARGSLGVIEGVAPGCAIQVGSVGAR